MKRIFFFVLLLTCKFAFAAPDSAEVYFKKGMTEKDSKRYLVAHQHFNKAIIFNPKYAEAYRQNGLVALEMRKTDLAMEQFNKLLELSPNDPEAIKQLTELNYSYRKYEKAIAFAKKCTSCEFTNRLIGMSYYQLEDYPEAIKFLKIAVDKNPGDAEATYTLGRTYLEVEDYKTASMYYNKAVALTPDKNTWSYELGLILYNIGDFKGAAYNFLKAKENGYTANNDFNENLAFSLLYSGDYDKGETLLQDVLRKKMNNVELLRSVAEVFYQQKQYDRSLVYCQKIMEMNPKDGKALYQAGLNFIKKGDKSKGQQMCDKAIEMDLSLQNMRQKKEIPGM